MYEVTEKILREVRKVIVGKDDVVEKVWISILAQGHVLLEDVPGVGKTTMALAFSKALGLETKRVKGTATLKSNDQPSGTDMTKAIDGKYLDESGYYWCAYGDYYVSYGDSSYDAPVEGYSMRLANSEYCVNK